MKVILGLGRIRKRFRRSVVALGIFDGLHRGHQRILKEAAKFSRRINGKSIVVTFFPHPAAQESLSSLPHRLKLISKLGIDICVVIRFTKKFAKIDARDFIKNILVKKFSPHTVFVGENFTFGKARLGDTRLLRKLAHQYGFGLRIFPILKSKGKIISSTYIRFLIKNGKIQEAENLLGRPVSVLGTVVKGRGQGRVWNIPTANINPHHEVLPKSGVYVVKVNFNNRILGGVCYIGTIPFLKDKKTRHIEVHIFCFKKNIYGRDLEILFIKRIRSPLRFVSKSILIEQIKKDIEKAKEYLNYSPS